MLGAGTAVYVLAHFRGWSYLSIGAFAMLAYWLWAVILAFKDKQHTHKSKAQGKAGGGASQTHLHLDKEIIQATVGGLVTQCNELLTWYNRALSGDDIGVAATATGALCVAWLVGALVSDATLLFAGFVALTLGPPLVSPSLRALNSCLGPSASDAAAWSWACAQCERVVCVCRGVLRAFDGAGNRAKKQN